MCEKKLGLDVENLTLGVRHSYRGWPRIAFAFGAEPRLEEERLCFRRGTHNRT